MQIISSISFWARSTNSLKSCSYYHSTIFCIIMWQPISNGLPCFYRPYIINQEEIPAKKQETKYKWEETSLAYLSSYHWEKKTSEQSKRALYVFRFNTNSTSSTQPMSKLPYFYELDGYNFMILILLFRFNFSMLPATFSTEIFIYTWLGSAIKFAIGNKLKFSYKISTIIPCATFFLTKLPRATLTINILVFILSRLH